MRSLLVALALTLAPAAAWSQESSLASLRAAQDGPGRLQLGRALRRAGHYDEAVRALQSVRDAATRPDAQWEIARVRFDQGAFRPAQQACNAFPPPSLRRHVCMARAYLVWNRVALAQREIDLARRVQPDDPELQLVVADSRRLASDMGAAETMYRAAASALPGRDEPYLGLGALHEVTQHFDDALAAYRQAVQTDGADPLAQLALGRFLLQRQSQPAEALPFLRRATQERPDWAEALTRYGEALLDARSWSDALAAFQRAVQLSPTQPGAQAGLGRAMIGLGRYNDAEAPLRTAIAQVATDAIAYSSLADVLEHTNRETDALQAWDDALDRAPSASWARMRAAELAHRTHQNALARAYLDRVLTDDPGLAGALYLRGVIAAEDGDRPHAREYFTQALAGHGDVDRAAVQQRIQELDAPQRVRRH